MPVFYLAAQEKRETDVIYVLVMVCQCLWDPFFHLLEQFSQVE